MKAPRAYCFESGSSEADAPMLLMRPVTSAYRAAASERCPAVLHGKFPGLTVAQFAAVDALPTKIDVDPVLTGSPVAMPQVTDGIACVPMEDWKLLMKVKLPPKLKECSPLIQVALS